MLYFLIKKNILGNEVTFSLFYTKTKWKILGQSWWQTDISNPTGRAYISLRVLYCCTIYTNWEIVVEGSVYWNYFINKHLIFKQAHVLKFNYFSYVMCNLKKQDYFFSSLHIYSHTRENKKLFTSNFQWCLDFKRISTNKNASFQDPDEFKDLHAHHQFTKKS